MTSQNWFTPPTDFELDLSYENFSFENVLNDPNFPPNFE